MVAAAVQWAKRIMRKIDNGKAEESSLRPLRHGVTNMTVDDFRQSLTAAKPPAELTLALAGLWWDAKDDWTRAHESAQQDEGRDGSWVHAYLHRKEGDQGNAAYWYSRAGKPFVQGASGCGMGQHRGSLARLSRWLMKSFEKEPRS